MARTSWPLTMMIWCEPMMIWKKILVPTHTWNPPQMSMKVMLLATLPPTSPTWYFFLLNLIHPARTTMASPCFLPSKSFPKNVEDVCLLELAKPICEIGAPLSAFSKILAWAGCWQMEGHTFKTADFPSYMMYVESLSKRLELDCLKYQMETIITPWGGPCTFPVFDFPSMFHSLLGDPCCCNNHLIDWEHPSHVPHHKIGLLDDVHSAKWYVDTHHMQIQSDSNEVLCGIILFID